MKTINFKCYAKINISLNVLSKREDGYHELDMVMVPLALHDTVLLSDLKNADAHSVTIDDFTYGGSHYTLATSVLNQLAEVAGFNNKFRIDIHKAIPIQSGLGGGSSDTAFLVKNVNQILNLGLTDEQLIDVVAPFGADIPFFIGCKPTRAQGIGNKLSRITIKNNYWVLLVKPEKGCSTKEVYETSDQMELKTGSIDTVIKALETGDDDLLAASIFNSLEQASITISPAISTIKEELKNDGVKIVGMSGSGSTVFALSQDKKLLKKLARKYENKYSFVELTKIIK